MLPRLRAVAAAALALVATARPALAGGRVACVGDSITIGSLLGPGESYPEVLGGLLGAGWTVGNFGDHGKTMMKAPPSGKDSYWETEAFARSQAFAPDRVVLMLGTNDAKVANWRGGASSFEADYRAMLALYAALPGRPRVLVALPPPVLAGSFTIDPRAFETGVLPAIARVAAAAGVEVVDVHAAFGGDPRRYFGKGDGVNIGDGVHPNPAGARLIAATVAAALAPPPAADAAVEGGADAAEAVAADGGGAGGAAATGGVGGTVGRTPEDAASGPDPAPSATPAAERTSRPGGCGIGGGGRPSLLLALFALLLRRRARG